MIDLVEQHRTSLTALCRKFRVRRLDLFGSAARGDFDVSRSDLDFMVEFEPTDWSGSSDLYFGLLHGLEDLFHRRIDLVEASKVKNPLFHEIAEQHQLLLYAA